MSKLTVAIAIGTITAIRTTEELWFRTSMDVLEIAAWAAVAYVAGIAITYAVVEQFHQRGGGMDAKTHRATAQKHPTRRAA